MTKLDQFQSVFLAADKTVLHYEKLAVERVLVVSDLDGDAAGELLNRVRTFLSVVDGEGTRWARLDGGGFSSVQQLLDAVDEQAPDLVVTPTAICIPRPGSGPTASASTSTSSPRRHASRWSSSRIPMPRVPCPTP